MSYKAHFEAQRAARKARRSKPSGQTVSRALTAGQLALGHLTLTQFPRKGSTSLSSHDTEELRAELRDYFTRNI